MIPGMLLALLSAALARADDSSYGVNAKCALDQLMRWYDADKGLWCPDDGGPYGWQSANMMSAFNDLAQLDDEVMGTYGWIWENTYNNAPANGPVAKRDDVGFTGNFYDDEGWWALAWIGALRITGTREYLDEAIAIWYDMNAGWNTRDCGGLPWKKIDDEYGGPLAIENELYIQIGAALANSVGDNQKDTYLDAAKEAWDWFQQVELINSDNLINDGVNVSTCKNSGAATFSYNQGVIIGGLVELYQATEDESYLDAASDIANAVTTPGSDFLDDNGILVDGCDKEQNCDDTSAQFKGVFVRNLKMLQAVRPSEQWKSFLETNAKSIWDNNLELDNGDCKLGIYWAGPNSDANAVSQSSALDCLNAALAVTS